MKGRLREVVLVIMVGLAFLQLSQAQIGQALTPVIATVDVFTQKQPFSGKGANTSSDAFGPQEVVFLYAEVTKGNDTIDNILVAFNIRTPNGANFSMSALTNSSGLATANFTIATPPINITENDVFGYWQVIGSVLYAGQTFSDTLTFRVDYVIKLLGVNTIDSNLTEQSSFGIGGDVGLEITLRSIAMVLRNATISVVVKDELDFASNFSQIVDFAVQPNEKLLFIYQKATLPKSMHIGNATVFISAFTDRVSDGGVPYCPDVQASFQVTPQNPLSIDLHDAAIVAVTPSANPVTVGQNLELATLVRNEGTVRETFTVSTYFDEVLLGTAQVPNLAPYATMSFSYPINPLMVTLGNHTISATVLPVTNEADLTDNNYNDTVIVEITQPVAAHDIAIVSVTTSAALATVGDTVRIDVVVLNKGNVSETFDVSAYYNSSVVATNHVVGLASLSEISSSFLWNTTSIAPGIYQISASAPLLDDINPSDNSLVDGIVEVSTVPQAHDVAVLSVLPYPSVVEAGQTVVINVTVKNKGLATESFHVTIYYGQAVAGDKLVTDLAPSAESVLSLEWNTAGIAPNTYVISALAGPVEGETQLADNTFVDGTVTVTFLGPFLPNEWLFLFFIVLIAGIAGIILLLLILALHGVRRRRPRQVYTVIAHPHI